MNCRKVRPYLYGYCKNELSPAESEKIKAHLDNCVECAREMEKVAEVSTLFKDSLEVLALSPDFDQKLLARIRSLPFEVEERKRQTWWQKLLHETFPSLRLRWAVAGADWSIDKIFEQAGRSSSVNDKSFVIENLSTASLDKAFDSTNRGEDGRITPVDLNRRFIIERSNYQDLSRGNHYILPVVSSQPSSKKTDY
jgi:hypothetical protein